MKKVQTIVSRGDGQLKTNLYINKQGELILKVTVHLPREWVKRLGKEAFNREITLSALISESSN